MATAYSYVRFSSKRQEQGDSVRRQEGMGEGWMRRHPEHVLDQTLKLHDLGISAFRGKNLDPGRGDLGKFIALVQQGRIAPGSILLLENLDRFSRQDPWDVIGIFRDLVRAGIEVVLLGNGEQTINKANMNHMDVFLPTVISMQLAHEESKKKSQRLLSVWRYKRQEAQANGKRLTRLCPAWLTVDETSGKFKVKPGTKRAVRYIFERACSGIGQRTIAGECVGKFESFTGRPWNSSYVQLLLGNRQLLGEFQPRKRGDDGEFVPDGPPLRDYFPAMIEKSLFDRAQAARKARRGAKGRNTQFVNLFVGLLAMPDGYAGNVWTTKHRRAGMESKVATRRIASYGHLQKQPGACPLTVDYGKVEAYVLALLYQLGADDLKPAADGGNGLAEKRQELAAVEQRAAELEAALTDPTRKIPELVRAAMALDENRKTINLEIERMQQEAAVVRAKPLEAAHDVLAAIASKPEADQHNLRLKLRGLIADIVERIDLEPKKIGRRVHTVITVTLRHWPDPRRIRINTSEIAPEDLPAAYARVRQDLPEIEHKARSRGGIKAHPVYVEVVADSLKGARADVVEIGYDETRIHYTGEAKDGTTKKPPRPRRAK